MLSGPGSGPGSSTGTGLGPGMRPSSSPEDEQGFLQRRNPEKVGFHRSRIQNVCLTHFTTSP